MIFCLSRYVLLCVYDRNTSTPRITARVMSNQRIIFFLRIGFTSFPLSVLAVWYQRHGTGQRIQGESG